MRYVTYDQNGILTGCFLQDVPQEHLSNFIEFPEELVTNWTSYKANTARNGVELAPIVIPQQTDEQFNANIMAQLAELDAKSIRPLREGETARVSELANQAIALRAQLRKI